MKNFKFMLTIAILAIATSVSFGQFYVSLNKGFIYAKKDIEQTPQNLKTTNNVDIDTYGLNISYSKLNEISYNIGVAYASGKKDMKGEYTIITTTAGIGYRFNQYIELGVNTIYGKLKGDDYKKSDGIAELQLQLSIYYKRFVAFGAYGICKGPSRISTENYNIGIGIRLNKGE